MPFIRAQAVLVTCWLCVIASASQQRTTLSNLPPAAQSNISAALGRDIPSYTVASQPGGYTTNGPSQALTVDFTSAGIQVHSRSAQWGITLRAYGRGSTLDSAQEAVPTASKNRVEYRRGAVTEWYVNGPLGLEQGFTLDG